MRSRTAGFRSMRARMTVLFACFVGTLMFLGSAAIAWREERREERRTKEILATAVDRVRDEVEEDNANANTRKRTLLQSVLANQSELAAGGLVLVVADARGILWRSRQHAPAWPAVSDDWRFQTMTRGDQTLILAYEWGQVKEHLEEMTRTLVQLSVLIVGATAVGAWLLVGKTLSPLDRLAAQAQNASTDSLQVRLQSPSSDAEMRHLTATLNELLTRLAKEAQARGRFYAAASHELRTPIQVLLGEIDVARSRPRSVAEHETTLSELQGHAERLANLVQDLLQLNALEMRQNAAPAEELNMAFWIERAIDQQVALIAAHDLQLETHIEEVLVTAPSAHIEILLRNLLENAVKYATPGTTLQVSMRREAKNAQLEIWNACGLPENTDLKLWFEPFFRPDAARNSQTGGNGLGLSIIMALVRANNWNVDLRIQNGGVLAVVKFPELSFQ